jgi:acetyl esterase
MRSSLWKSTKSSSSSIPLLCIGLALLVSGLAQGSDGLGSNRAEVQAQLEPASQIESKTKEPDDSQLQATIAQLAAAGAFRPRTVQEARRAYLFYSKLAGPPERVSRVEDQNIPGPGGNIPIRLYYPLYYPRSESGLPLLVFFHGGGFVTGSLDTHDTPLRATANRCECIVVSVGYRLAPENPYPAAPEDAYASTKWVADHATEIGGDPSRLAVGGDGVGGNLAAVVTLMARDHGGPRLIFQTLIYPILNLTMLTRSWVVSNDPVLTADGMVSMSSLYVPVNTDLEDAYLSPTYAKNFEGLPPAFITTGVNDPVRDEAQTYATYLQRSGVPVVLSNPNLIHNFFLMAGWLDVAQTSIDEIGAAVRQAFQAASDDSESFRVSDE